jgi:tetratricopeptide (TPR) repeat protein
MKNIIYSLLLSFAFGAFAQNTKINSGNKQSQKLAYIDAIKTYEKIVKKGFVNAEICKKIADAYYYNANYKVASEWYQKALELANDFNPEYYYRYAISLKSSNQIEESEKYMAKYVSVVPEHNRAQILKKI